MSVPTEYPTKIHCHRCKNEIPRNSRGVLFYDHEELVVTRFSPTCLGCVRAADKQHDCYFHFEKLSGVNAMRNLQEFLFLYDWERRSPMQMALLDFFFVIARWKTVKE